MTAKRKYICRDFGRPGCGSIPDPRYTMRFDDLGEEPVYWCTRCGKEAAEVNKMPQERLRIADDFIAKFKKAVEAAIKEQQK